MSFLDSSTPQALISFLNNSKLLEARIKTPRPSFGTNSCGSVFVTGKSNTQIAKKLSRGVLTQSVNDCEIN